MATDRAKLPRFALIKQYLQSQIESGDWPIGTCTPSENELAASFSVSRMTARRALQELADEGMLSRIPGQGSFVAKPEKKLASIDIYDQLKQAQADGTYSNRLISLDSVVADQQMADLMHLGLGDNIDRLVIVHLHKNNPVQWQQLSINPVLAPAIGKQKFNRISPDDYLEWVSPSTSEEHQLMAVLPSAGQRRELALLDQTACLRLTRRSWSGPQVRSLSIATYPSAHYNLGVNLLDTSQ